MRISPQAALLPLAPALLAHVETPDTQSQPKASMTSPAISLLANALDDRGNGSLTGRAPLHERRSWDELPKVVEAVNFTA